MKTTDEIAAERCAELANAEETRYWVEWFSSDFLNASNGIVAFRKHVIAASAAAKAAKRLIAEREGEQHSRFLDALILPEPVDPLYEALDACGIVIGKSTLVKAYAELAKHGLHITPIGGA